MNTERIKEIQSKTAYPDSISVQQALLQVWNECEQEQLRIAAVSGRSEQFVSLIRELINVGIIDEDDIDVEVWVKNYLKETNCH